MKIPQEITGPVESGLQRLTDLHKAAGVFPTYSCRPYCHNDLRMGQHVAITEFNVVSMANSWFGARTNPGGQSDTLAAAVTGKTPECGLHLMENRWGEVLIEVSEETEPEKFDSSDYGALGYWAGKLLVDRIPVYHGLPRDMSSRQLEYLGVGQILGSSAVMLHVVGVTPEAPSLEVALGGRSPEETFVFGKKDLDDVYQELNSAADNKVDMVLLGCPHSPIEEISQIAQLLHGKKVAKGLRFWVGTSPSTYNLAKDMGLVDIIEGAGGFVLSGVCAGSGLVMGSAHILGVKVVANNGLTFSGFANKVTRGNVEVCFGNIEKCVNSAVSGYWEG